MSLPAHGPFCDNPQCPFHYKVCPVEQTCWQYTEYTPMVSLTHQYPDMVTHKEIKRHKLAMYDIYAMKGYNDRFVCDTCFEVYKMLSGE